MRSALFPKEIDCTAAACMAAALYADHIVSLIAAPAAAGPQTERETGWAELWGRWRWVWPLWRDGVLVDQVNNASPLDLLEEQSALWREEPRLAPLRDLLTGPSRANELDAGARLARELLRQGSDAGIDIAGRCALEQFAARHDLTLLITHNESIMGRRAARAPARLRLALPVLYCNDGDALLELRQQLSEVLDSMRQGLSDAAEAVALGERPDEDGLQRGAEEVREAFIAAVRPGRQAAPLGRPGMVAWEMRMRDAQWSLRQATKLAARLSRPNQAAASQPVQCETTSEQLVAATVRPLPWEI